ncbi:metal-dependent transcriptional regulator [Georgenia faecalis]|uniref:metal-dependent transcriptional regulator n=1 Tax=Georgenia faecalis TaxID=2483799 RepID=UPI000FDC88FC|nr:metal-dependent transcriptional regulator [Georgenia faecalis]
MSVPSSNVAQDYLKTVYTVGEWGDARVTVSALATRMAVSASTASETVRRLAEEGLVHHERYGGITLTEEGRHAALAMVRRHRLLETWLVEQLGYAWDEVHDEAEVLEHAVSDLLVERLDALLGHPLRDPHGDPIPRADGTVEAPAGVPLHDVAEGEGGPVVRLSDAEPQVLRLLADAGLVLDVPVRVVERRAFAGTTVLSVGGPTAGDGRTTVAGRTAEAGRTTVAGRTAEAGRTTVAGRTAEAGRTTVAGRTVELGDPVVAAVWVGR